MPDEKDKKKEPIEMTTEEAIDYVFAPEIAEALRAEAAKGEPLDEPESED